MSKTQRVLALLGVMLLSLVTASIVSAAHVDPPERVARLSYTTGDVSYSPAGENEWFSVVRNRPLIRGDRLWTDRGARAEFQVGSSAVRLDSHTSVDILELNDRFTQIQLTQGTLNLSVRRMYPGQSIEVATPTLAYIINRAGRYRIDVDPRHAVTTIVVWEGAGVAYGENSSFPLRAGDTVRFYDTDLRDYRMYGLPREDNFDRYCLDRDHRLERSASLRYLDDDVVGYQDLDEYGNWRPVNSYGNVWFPNRVDNNWAPYRDGHWVWQDPWGWTWVDHAPWGFAPSHYGRWIYVSNRWGWVPGPRNVRPVYAPALVAFVGGHGWSVSLSLGDNTPIGWFPLGPREVYVPPYTASRDYFNRVNVNNTVVNNTVINNVYNNYSSGTINVNQVNYANRTVTGAVTAVPANVFINAQPVQRAAIRLDSKTVTSGEITRVAPIAPSVRSVIGGGTAAKARPSREAVERRVIAHTAPPPEIRSFAARKQQLEKHPGQTPELSTAESEQSHNDKATRNIRVIGEQRGAVNARDAGSRRSGGKPGTPSGTPGQLQPLDRSVEPANGSEPGTSDQSRDKEQKGQSDAQKQRQDKADSERKTADQQKAEERQRQTDSDQKTADQQQAERQRQVDAKQHEQLQRKAADKRETVDQQNAERQRQVELSRQEQGQRKASSQPQDKTATQKQEEQRQTECVREAIRLHQDVRQCQPQDKIAMQKQEEERQAECEREAIRLHQDVRQCLPQATPDISNTGKNHK
jgi:hypothetical protein